MDGPPPNRRKRLGEILIASGLIDDMQLHSALAEQRKWGGRLGKTLVEMGFVDEGSMVQALANQLRLPPANLDGANLPEEVTRWLRVDLAERYGVFPMAADPKHKLLKLASADPTNADALKELSFATGMKIEVFVAAASAIERAIRHYYYGEATTSVPTAKPADIGVSEQVFDPVELVPEDEAPPAAAPVPVPMPVLDARLLQLSQQLAALQNVVGGQARAIRSLIEILVEKGVLTREEYLAKVKS